MIRRAAGLLGVICLGLLAATPAAHAFTLENDPAKSVPKFDFDDQLRQFRNTPQGLGAAADATKKGYETPFGTLQFGVSRGQMPYMSPFTSQFGASNSGNASRRHYERLFTHPDLQHLYD